VAELGHGVDGSFFLADPLELALELVPVLGDVGGVVVGAPPGLSLELTPALGLVPPLGLAPPLPDGLGLPLAVLLAPPLVDVAGALVVPVVLCGELFLVCFTDGLVDGDAQALDEETPTGAGLVAGAPCVTDGTAEGVPWLSVAPAPFEELLLMLKAEPMASPTCAIAERAGGTTDRTTPTANTAVPMAKAGRSMASRQSRGRRGPGASFGRAGWPRRRISRTSAAQMAIKTPRIPLGWLAWAGRDRILSRIRSRPSAPGST
jgi:hypothetical protein